MTIPERAKQCLSALVEHVLRSAPDTPSPLTYERLAELIGRLRTRSQLPHPRGMGKILGSLGHMLLDLQTQNGIRIPEIQSLVVNKNGRLKGFPDDGIKEFWKDYPKMSKIAKIDRLAVEYARIAQFGIRWNDVLVSLGLPAVQPPPVVRGGRAGGESLRHLALKEAVRQNPHLVGAGADWESIVECPLRSLDLVDVVFRSADTCIAVEVKSRISSEDDCRRGIYQTIKYRAILEAMHTARDSEGRQIVRSLLVIEGALTPALRTLAQRLGVTVIENFRIPELAAP